MTSLKDRVATIISNYGNEYSAGKPVNPAEEADQIIALFQQEVMAALPEKVKLDTSVYQNEGDGYASERIGYKHGYNDALKDMESRLKERLELAPASQED